jgi:hypothetical protein
MESLESRVDGLEAVVHGLDIETKLRDIGECLDIIYRVLADVTSNLSNSEEYAADMDRLELVARLMR